MSQARRKRKRSLTAEVQPPPGDPPAPAPAPAPHQSSPDDGLRRGYARSRARDDELRANLPPLAPGERPRIVTLAAVVAFVFAIANAAAALSGNDISTASGDPSISTAVTSAVLLVAGIGMLAGQYWAVLGFQTILGIQIVFFSLSLIGVQKLGHAVIYVVAIGLLGWLFWKLVRPMAQLQVLKQQPVERAP
jgi:hypothetical protein